MAKALPGINFIGTIDGISAYKRRDVEGVIIRRKGGPSAKQVRSSGKFQRTRENNAEFGALARFSKLLKNSLFIHSSVFDFNLNAAFMKPLKQVQISDELNPRGQREVLLSKFQWILEGFELNRKFSFSSIINSPLGIYIDKENGWATIKIPPLINGINFHQPVAILFFQLRASLGIIPDLIYQEGKYEFSIKGDIPAPVTWNSDWEVFANGSDGVEIKLNLEEVAEGNFSRVIALSLALGSERGGEVREVEYMGGGLIVKLD